MERRNRYVRLTTATAVALLAASFAVPNLRAQLDTGTLTGRVTDPSGAVIPNAKVDLTNQNTNFTITTITTSAGDYTFTPIYVGTYTVTVNAHGFTTAVHKNIRVNIAEDVAVNFSLTPGRVTTVVTVTSAAPALQTQNASVGQVVTSRSVNDLPLNGRNMTFLAQTIAGVNTPQADTRGNAASGAFSANGLRPDANDYLLNGIDNNSNNVDFLNGTNFVALPPPDALSEFKVQTSDYSAEYGRSGGAILNATIKSGTNAFHGDVWDYLRNDAFDAADYYEDNGGVPKGEFRQNQFGATFGGPIIKNKLFFFADYQGTRRVQGTVYTNSVPTPGEVASGFTDLSDEITEQACSTCNYSDDLGRTFPNGTEMDPATEREVIQGQVDPVTGLKATGTGYVEDPFFTGGSIAGITNFTGYCTATASCELNQLPNSRIDPNALKILGLFPKATKSGIILNNTTDPNTVESENQGDTRLDYNMNTSNQLAGTFDYSQDPIFIPGPFQGIADGGAFTNGNQQANALLTSLSYTHIFSPTLVNEARIGEDRLYASREGPVAGQNGIPAEYGIQGVPQFSGNGGLPAIYVGSLNTLGSNAYLPSNEITQTTQATENLTKMYGKHTFKMGMEFQHVKFSTFQPTQSHGEMGFGQYADFLINPEATTVPGGVNDFGGSNDIYMSNAEPTDDGRDYWGAYFNDSWKMTRKLTAQLGVRWEWFGQIYEMWGRQGNFLPAADGSSAEYIEPNNGKNQQIDINPDFDTLLAANGVSMKYVNTPALGTSPLDNIGPRVGVAYEVTPKLVVRSGFGMFYNAFQNVGYGPNIGENYPYQFTLSYAANTPPTEAIGQPVVLKYANGNVCAPVAIIETGFSCLDLVPSQSSVAGIGFNADQYNMQTPVIYEYNLTTEYQIKPSMTATVGFVGDQSRHNFAFTGANSPSTIELNPVEYPAYPYPTLGGIGIEADEGNSAYNSLQTSLEKRFSNGVSFLATYTWSHCRGDSGDPLNGGDGEGYRAPLLPGFGIQGDYGNCDYNVYNVFHLSGGYNLPFGHGEPLLNNAKGVTNALLGGWQTEEILTDEGGQPMTLGCPYSTNNSFGCDDMIIPGATEYGAPEGHYLNSAAFTMPCPATGFPQPSRCVPNETGVGLLGGAPGYIEEPGIFAFDFSLFKNFKLSERFSLQFRSEFYNLFNIPTFNAPNFGGNGVVSVGGSGDYLDSTFGEIGSTRFQFKDPRQIQFALKLFF